MEAKGKADYQVLGQHSQVLQVLLLPGQDFYLNGVSLIYGSEAMYAKLRELMNLNFLNLRNSMNLRRLLNITDGPEYVGVRKGTGKVLVINCSLYKEMFVSASRVMATNFEPELTRQVVHGSIGGMKLIQPVSRQEGNTIFLQGNSETYIEKELAEGQKIVTELDNILAFEKSANVSWAKGNVVLEGPGFVFLSAPSNFRTPDSRNLSKFIYVLVLVILLELVFVKIGDLIA